MNAVALELTTEFFLRLLRLPPTSEVIDLFIDPWTKNLVLIVQDAQFPEKHEGQRFPVYRVVVARTGTMVHEQEFVKYEADVHA